MKLVEVTCRVASICAASFLYLPALAELPLRDRVDRRDYPSVFQAWAGADVPNVSKEDVRARHDLILYSPTTFGLVWDGPTVGEANSLKPNSIEVGLIFRNAVLAKNDCTVLLAAVPYYDAWSSWLPADHHWWKRNGQGSRLAGWQYGPEPFYLLDYDSDELRAHIARQSAALTSSGVVDGVFLDWFSKEDLSRIDLVQRIRAAIGPDKLILVNSNFDRPIRSAPFINGIFMETDPNRPLFSPSPRRSPDPNKWRKIVFTLQWAERTLRQPRINALETKYTRSRDEPRNMRMTTTAALTLSNGYSLFCDPNYLPTPGHGHDWYDFWDVNLGRPAEPPRTDANRVQGGFVRKFTKGVAAFNPPYNDESMLLRFAKPARQASTGTIGTSFQLLVGDGDIYLFDAATPESK